MEKRTIGSLVEMEELTVFGLFSGIGGLEEGFVQAGMRLVGYSEIDEKCSALMAERMPSIPNFGDVRNVTKEAIEEKIGEPIAVVCGGPPCQDFSIAGKRAGLAGSRSGLWFEFLRVLAELRPQWAVVENVPGILSSCGCTTCKAVRRIIRIHKWLRKRQGGVECPICVAGKRMLKSHRGRDFATVLEGLAELGYFTAGRILDAQYHGVAQRRRRVFLVCHLGDGRASEVLFERESLSWDTAPRREAGAGVAATVTPRVGGSGRGWPRLNEGDGLVVNALTAFGVGVTGADDNQAQAGHLIANPLASHPGRNAGEDNYVPVVGALPAHSPRHGHAMTTQQAAESGQLIAQSQYGDVAGTLSARHDSSPCADRGQNVIAYQCQGNNVGPMGALRQGNGGLTGGVPFVFQSKASASQSMNPSEIAPTLDVGKSGGMVVAQISPCLGKESYSPAKSSSGQMVDFCIGARAGVRRLTPTECERLQGFFDGWTDNGQSDSARYRQLGNAVCRAVAEWIGRQIIKACGD